MSRPVRRAAPWFLALAVALAWRPAGAQGVLAGPAPASSGGAEAAPGTDDSSRARERRLGLDEALSAALASHRDAERARLAWHEARLARQGERLRLAPRLQVDLSAPSIVDARNETWALQGDSLRLVWVDWNQRRESAALRLRQEGPLGTTLDLGAEAWHRRSDSGSFDEEHAGQWSARVRQSLLPRSIIWGDLREGEAEADQAGLEALEQLAEFRHRVALAFLALLRRQEALALARQDLLVSAANRDRAAARLEAGLIAESDYLKVELDDLRQRAAFQADSLGAVLEGRAFMRLLGRPEAPAPPLDPALPEIEAPAAGEVDAALAGNARLARQRLEVVKARRAERLARWERLPELSLDAAWTWREEDEGWRWRPEEPGLDRSLSLDLSWPLYAGGERARAVARAGLARRRAELADGALGEELAAEWERLRLQTVEQRLQLPLLERQLELAERDAAISRERFQAGQITSQDLIDADRALSRARLALLELRMAQTRARLDLARLAGADRAAVRDLLLARDARR